MQYQQSIYIFPNDIKSHKAADLSSKTITSHHASKNEQLLILVLLNSVSNTSAFVCLFFFFLEAGREKVGGQGSKTTNS